MRRFIIIGAGAIGGTIAARLSAAGVPVVAVAAREPTLVASPREVAEILRVPVRHFLPEAPIEVVEAERDGWQLRYGAFPIGRHRVWGATGRILGQLGAVLGMGAP